MMSTIEALACAVDAKDQYTHDHSGRVARLSVATARALGVRDEAACRDIELSGLLHDIGKIGIPDAILSKPARLDPQEYEIIKTHVRVGAEIVGKVAGLENVAKAILHHHERYDGLGYPAGLSGEKIPLASKLIAVSDTYDSLTSDRAYRKRTTRANGLAELNRCTGTQFDPAVVEAFASVVQRNPEWSP
jgi:putative nucleotidyltransferase with HDIG domain